VRDCNFLNLNLLCQEKIYSFIIRNSRCLLSDQKLVISPRQKGRGMKFMNLPFSIYPFLVYMASVSELRSMRGKKSYNIS